MASVALFYHPPISMSRGETGGPYPFQNALVPSLGCRVTDKKNPEWTPKKNPKENPDPPEKL